MKRQMLKPFLTASIAFALVAMILPAGGFASPSTLDDSQSCVQQKADGSFDFRSSVETFVEWRRSDEASGLLADEKRYESDSENCLHELTQAYLSLTSDNDQWVRALQELETLIPLHPTHVLSLIFQIEESWESNSSFYLPYAEALRAASRNTRAQTTLLHFVTGAGYLLSGGGASTQVLQKLRYFDRKRAMAAIGLTSGTISAAHTASSHLNRRGVPPAPSQVIRLSVNPEVQILARAEEMREQERFYAAGASAAVMGTLLASRVARVSRLAASISGGVRTSAKLIRGVPKGLATFLIDPLVWIGSDWAASQLQEKLHEHSLERRLIHRAGALNRGLKQDADEATMLGLSALLLEDAILFEFYHNQQLFTAELEAKMERREGASVAEVSRKFQRKLKQVQEANFKDTPDWFRRYRVRYEMKKRGLNPLIQDRLPELQEFVQILEENGSAYEAQYAFDLSRYVFQNASSSLPADEAFAIALQNAGVDDDRRVAAQFYLGRIPKRPDALWAQIEIALRRTGARVAKDHLIPIYVEPRLDRYLGGYGAFEVLP